MIKMGKETSLSPEQVIDKAVAFFGPEGWGLRVMEQGSCCARFESAGGHIFVQTSAREKGSGSRLEIEGREWEPQIRKFMDEV